MYKCKMFCSDTYDGLERAINYWLEQMSKVRTFEFCDISGYTVQSGVMSALVTYFVVTEDEENGIEKY